jgi:uncharacterized protein YneF (UPF0154 family)
MEATGGVAELAEVAASNAGRELGFMFIGIGVGLSVGYLLTRKIVAKRLETKYAEIAESEIEQVRALYLQKGAEPKPTTEPKPSLDEVVERRGYRKPFTPEEQAAIDEIEAQNLTRDIEEETVEEVSGEVLEDSWDFAEEVKRRAPDLPYIIHLDEFRENESEYDQVTYSYYEDDDVLADEKDGVIHATDMIVSPEILHHFGHGSKDPNVVYVRNDRLSLDIEICKNPGNYGEIVQGFTKDIEHSDKRSKRRRGFDDDQDD